MRPIVKAMGRVVGPAVMRGRPDFDLDGPEDHQHECREDAAAERDQDVVDEQLARESDEVHAARDQAPVAAGVRDAYDQPERDPADNARYTVIQALPQLHWKVFLFLS